MAGRDPPGRDLRGGRDPRGRDDWDDEGEARRAAYGGFTDGSLDYSPGPGRRDRGDDYREPGDRADYRIEQGLTREDRDAIGPAHPDAGRGSYAPTAEQATGRERRGWDDRADPGAWFGGPHAEKAHPFGPHRGRGPKGYTRSGERIREDVSDRLMRRFAPRRLRHRGVDHRHRGDAGRHGRQPRRQAPRRGPRRGRHGRHPRAEQPARPPGARARSPPRPTRASPPSPTARTPTPSSEGY